MSTLSNKSSVAILEGRAKENSKSIEKLSENLSTNYYTKEEIDLKARDTEDANLRRFVLAQSFQKTSDQNLTELQSLKEKVIINERLLTSKSLFCFISYSCESTGTYYRRATKA